MDINREIAEKWIALNGSDGWYEISNYGRMRSWKHKNGRRKKPFILSESLNGRGYVQYHLFNKNDRLVVSAHRAVLEHFIGKCPKGMAAAHNNGNRQDNRLKNIRWDTLKNNVNDRWRHGTMLVGSETNCAKLSNDKVVIIRKLSTAGMTGKEISKLFGIHHTTACRIINRETWRHI